MNRTPESAMHDWRSCFVDAAMLAGREKLTPTGLFLRQLPDHNSCTAFAGIKMPENVPCLVFRLSVQTLRRIDFRMATRGFISETISSPLSPNEIDLVIRRADDSFSDHFELMAGDLLTSSSAETDSVSAGAAVYGRLEQWRSFCARFEARLGIDQLIGLAAELSILKFLIDGGLPPEAVIQAWVGPLGHQHDIRFPRVSIEVKSCRSREGLRVTFSSSQQLEKINDDPLYLAVVRVTQNDPAGASIEEIVSSLRGKLDTQHLAPALNIFNSRLLSVGYSDAPVDGPSIMMLQIEEPLFFHIHDDFPRIRSGDVPSEIDRLTFRMVIPSAENPVCPQWADIAF